MPLKKGPAIKLAALLLAFFSYIAFSMYGGDLPGLSTLGAYLPDFTAPGKEAPQAQTPSQAVNAYTIGRKVQVKWNEKWWPAVIVDAGDNCCKIHFEGWGASYDETAAPERIRIPEAIAYEKDQRVDVEARGKWYGGVILEVKGPLYKIRFDGYDDSWDEWVDPIRINAK